jgi:hypothetical protein
VRVHTRLNEQYINVDLFNDPTTVLPSIGDPVALSFSPDACRVLGQVTLFSGFVNDLRWRIL